jgi:hypothetical protein
MAGGPATPRTAPVTARAPLPARPARNAVRHCHVALSWSDPSALSSCFAATDFYTGEPGATERPACLRSHVMGFVALQEVASATPIAVPPAPAAAWVRACLRPGASGLLLVSHFFHCPGSCNNGGTCTCNLFHTSANCYACLSGRYGLNCLACPGGANTPCFSEFCSVCRLADSSPSLLGCRPRHLL